MPADYDKQEIFKLISDVVSPYVGDVVGSSVGAAFSKKLGLVDADRLSGEDIENILKQLSLAMKVFLGEAKAVQVHDEVKRAIENRSTS